MSFDASVQALRETLDDIRAARVASVSARLRKLAAAAVKASNERTPRDIEAGFRALARDTQDAND